MNHTIKAVVRYDGTDFVGWQIQPNGRTVQQTLEEALSQIAGKPIKIAGAGRTDSGVHALGQVFSASWPDSVPLEKLHRSLNKMVGPEIRVESIETAPDDFHASFSAAGKRYAYTIDQASYPDPLSVRYAWNVTWPFERKRLVELAQTLVGEHDFAGYCCSGSAAKTTVRTIHSITLQPGPVVGPLDTVNAFHLIIHGNGFLYKMIRNIMGTLVDVARGHLPESTIQERLEAPAPYRGYTAPACGLFMQEVIYED
ncbi:MAG: tRNA pseudouridine(38-40) synthase TruA [Candidatus Hydrogenedentota bacterium]|nr:MAG: tRNA pseudouridine(38-40) synthase TruA [Candidatus Hydrogenedentota bacterium]